MAPGPGLRLHRPFRCAVWLRPEISSSGCGWCGGSHHPHVLGVDVVPATTSQVGPVGGGGEAVALGTIEGMCTLVGVALLIYRRRAIGPVFMAITRNDKSMCLVVFAIVAGLATTALGSGVGAEHDYPGNRPAVVPVVVHRPIRHRGAAPSFKVHALIGRLLFASWPFTRVVHACTAPLGDLFRP